MFCPNCGKPNNQNAKFCASCGSNLSQMYDEPVNPMPGHTNPTYAPVDAQGVVRNVTKSLPYLLTAMCFSISMILSFILSLNYEKITSITELFDNEQIGMIIYISVYAVLMIPSILSVCGLWIQYSSANDTSHPLTTSGLKCIMVAQGISVFNIVALFIVALYGIGKSIIEAIENNSFAVMGTDGSYIFKYERFSDSDIEEFKTKFIYLGIIGTIIVIFAIIYLINLIYMLLRSKDAVKYGIRDSKQPIYFYLFSLLLAIYYIYVSVVSFEEFSLLSILYLLNVAGFLLSAYTMFCYASQMNKIPQ